MLFYLLAIVLPLIPGTSTADAPASMPVVIDHYQIALKAQSSAIDSACRYQSEVCNALGQLHRRGLASPRELAREEFQLEILTQQSQQLTKLLDQWDAITVTTEHGSFGDRILLLPVPQLCELAPRESGFVAVSLHGSEGNELAKEIQQLVKQRRQLNVNFAHHALERKIARLQALPQDSVVNELRQLRLRLAAINIQQFDQPLHDPLVIDPQQHWTFDGHVQPAVHAIPAIAQSIETLKARFQAVKHIQNLNYLATQRQALTKINASARSPREIVALNQEIDQQTSAASYFSQSPDAASRLAQRRKELEVRAQRHEAIVFRLKDLHSHLVTLSAGDQFFQPELDANQRQLAIGIARSLHSEHQQMAHQRAARYFESRFTDTDARTNLLIELLQTVIADESPAAVADMEWREAALRHERLLQLNLSGDASWWECQKAKVQMQELQQQRQRLRIQKQILTKTLMAVRKFGSDAITSQDQLLATPGF